MYLVQDAVCLTIHLVTVYPSIIGNILPSSPPIPVSFKIPTTLNVLPSTVIALFNANGCLNVDFAILFPKTRTFASGELISKNLIKEVTDKRGRKYITLTDSGFRYIEKYKLILGFIKEFEL